MVLAGAREYWESYLSGVVLADEESGRISPKECLVARLMLSKGALLHPFYEAIHPGARGGGVVCWEVVLRCVLQIGATYIDRGSELVDHEVLGKNSGPVRELLNAIAAAIDFSKGEWLGAIPSDYEMSDVALAALINVLLDLQPEVMIDAKYIAMYRSHLSEENFS